jgi:hypothetical protein
MNPAAILALLSNLFEQIVALQEENAQLRKALEAVSRTQAEAQ